MARGRVRSFDDKKGGGYIAPDDGTPDVFVHVSAAESAGMDRLRVGDVVTYDKQYDRLSDRNFAINLVGE